MSLNRMMWDSPSFSSMTTIISKLRARRIVPPEMKYGDFIESLRRNGWEKTVMANIQNWNAIDRDATKRELLQSTSPEETARSTQSMIDVYDHYLEFGDGIAEDFNPNIQRLVCRTTVRMNLEALINNPIRPDPQTMRVLQTLQALPVSTRERSMTYSPAQQRGRILDHDPAPPILSVIRASQRA
jgi:hypothetical protein